MTKEVPQKRGTVSSGGSQGCRKLTQEVTVVKHYQPNPIRKFTPNFPEVKAFQDFPTTTRYLQLNPVFKLVDNYLASKQPACGHTPLNGALPPSSPVKNCRCSCLRYVQGDTTLKNFATKKSSVPVAGGCPHKNRVRLCLNPTKVKCNNMNNLNSKTNVGISLKNGYVPPCEVPVLNIGQCSTQNSYVEQLKTEIKNNRMDYCKRNEEYPDYVSKLKDEIIVNKTQCINEARAIINELKNEILNFRLRPKHKYSSSCSNLQTCGDNVLTTVSNNLALQKSKESPEKICACASKQATCCPTPGKEKAADLERLRPCETLWRTSRGSFASSSDMDAMSSPSPGVTFEQKLEEANSLIEKVRKALKDIGKGIQHKPPDKRKFFDINEPIEECLSDSKCVNMVCSFHGTCSTKASKSATAEKKLAKPEGEVEKEKEEVLRKQVEVQLRKQIKEEMAKEKADEESRRQKEEELSKKKEKLQKKQLEENSALESVESADKDLSGREPAFDNVNRSSMDHLQKKLKTISQVSSESPFKHSEIPPAVPEENSDSEEEKNSKDDSLPKSISVVNTESASSTVKSSVENLETVDQILEANDSDTKLPCDGECKSEPEAEGECCGEKYDYEDVNTKDSQGRTTSKQSNDRDSIKEKGKGSAYAIEGRRKLKESINSNDDKKRSRQESSVSSKLCEIKNLKESTEDFDGKASGNLYGDEEERRQSKESKSSRSYDFANIQNSSDDSSDKKRLEIERRRSNRQSKSKSSTEASSTKSGKLSIQVMPPVNIRGGLVMQKTLNLCIKPTGSSTNVIVGEHPNIGYTEVKTKCEKEDNELLKNMCPEDCGDLDHRCKYRVLGTILGPRKSKSETIDTHSLNGHKVDPDLINALNENALLLYKSYQILDSNKCQPTANVASTSSLTVTSKLARNIADTRKSLTSHFGRKPRVVDKTEEDVIKQVLEHGKTPWEIGFYQTKGTQCSGTSLNVQYENASLSNSSDELGSDSVSQIEEVIPSIYEEVEREMRLSLESQPLTQEEPVKDESPVGDEYSIETATRIPNMNLSEVINALKSGANAEMQKLLMEKLKNYDTSDLSVHSKRSQVVLESPPGDLSPPLKFEPLTESDLERRGPRKSILSNRISINELPSAFKKHLKKSVSSSSSSTSTAEEDDLLKASAALIAADMKVPKKVTSSSSSTTSSTSTSSSYNIHGSVRESVEPKEKVAAGPQVQLQETSLPTPIIEEPEAEQNQEQDGKKDENMQASSAPTTASETSESDSTFSHSRERMNTITCFIKGLTGTSQEQLDKLRSNPSFPKTDIREWSTTQMKTLNAQHQRTSDHKEPMSKRSIYETTLEEIMDSHDYGDKNDEERGNFPKERLSESTQLSDVDKKKRVKDFQTFAKETIVVPTSPKKGSASSKVQKKKGSAIVMTMTEERDKFEAGDECPEGGAFTNFTRRDLPFYRRVLGRVVDPATRQPIDVVQSDPVPFDDSVSEGEIKCKCSVSIGEVHPCKYNFDKWTGGAKQLKKHSEEPIRKEFAADKSLRISRQRTQYNNWVAFYLQKRKPIVFNDSSSTSPINSSDK